MFGFILTRCVKTPLADKYWVECYQNIRKLWPDARIIIVDDNSELKLVTPLELANCIVIRSDFPGRGEFLPYYYFHKLKPFDKAVIIHDSIFIKKTIFFENVEDVRFLWTFDHIYNDAHLERPLIEKFDPTGKFMKLYDDTSKWSGCYGAMSVITWDFVNKLFTNYNLENLIPHITCRNDRCSFERVFALACHLEKPSLALAPSIFGKIHQYMHWGYTWDQYEQERSLINLPIIKVWTGR